MGAAKRVFRHTLIQIGGRAIGTLLGLVAIGVMTRALQTAGFGAYTTITAYLGIFAVLADFGISTTLVAMMAEKGADEERLAQNGLGLRIILTAVVLTFASAIALFTPYPPEIKRGIALMAISFVAIAANQVQIAIFQRHVRMDRPAIAEIFGRIVLVAGVLFAAAENAGLTGMMLAVIGANIAQTLLAALLLRGLAPTRPAFEWQAWSLIVARAWPVGVSIAFNLIYLRADTLILSLTRSQGEVGLYGAAYRVVDVLTVVPMLFMGVVLPFLATAWSAGDKERFNRTLTRALDALTLGALPLAAGAVAVGPDLLALVAGEPFRASGEILRVLIFGVAAIFISAASTHAIVAVNEQRKMIPLLAANAAVSLALYVILIPRYGVAAAAGVTVFSEIFAALSAMAVVAVTTNYKFQASVFIRAAAAALAMAFVDHWLAPLPLALRILADSGVYASLALIFGATDIHTLKTLLSWRDEAPPAPRPQP